MESVHYSACTTNRTIYCWLVVFSRSMIELPMKMLSYLHDGAYEYGAAIASGVVDLTRRLPAFPTLQDLIASDALADARAIVATADRECHVDYQFKEIQLAPPILHPETIWCIGVNYADRNEEYNDKSDQPRYPNVFTRTVRSFVGHKTPLERPRVSVQLDYEGEIVLVVGRAGKHICAETALEHVFGLTLSNEGTVRDWLHHGKFNVTQGKNFDRSGSVGPWIVTADTLDLTAPLTLTTRVNGEMRQRDTTSRMIFSFTDLLVYLSAFTTLMPGDLIVTGTPTGAGARLDPPVWLKPGDNVQVEVPEIGILENDVIDEP
jgi:2-keto-4-pentenoate hydratase/2-oxohepta-3-ene-1,7-dioic acid hydratase in catechol pathway